MRPFTLLLLIFALGAANNAVAQNEWKQLLSKEQYRHNDFVLPYRLFQPGESQKYPLVVFLHGAGERGTDNELQLLHGVKHFMSETIREEQKFILIAPQCPTDARWTEVDWTLASHKMPARISVPLAATFALIDSLIQQGIVDSTQIFITGLSMGGFGTWDALARRPGFFAAAMPVCGGGDEAQACKMTMVPIKAFHGKLDHLVMPSRSINMVNAVTQCGGRAEYIIFPSLGHLCWEQVYSDLNNIRWLLQHKRNN